MNNAMLEMRVAVEENLVECCRELLEWDRTGQLKVGRIRGIADKLKAVEPSDPMRRVKIVRHEIEQQAVEFVFAKSVVGNGITYKENKND